jgi:hypothetical protein
MRAEDELLNGINEHLRERGFDSAISGWTLVVKIRYDFGIGDWTDVVTWIDLNDNLVVQTQINNSPDVRLPLADPSLLESLCVLLTNYLAIAEREYGSNHVRRETNYDCGSDL